jgi:hypothetical protein
MTREFLMTTSGYAFCDTVNDPQPIDPPTNTGGGGGGGTTPIAGDPVLSDYVEAPASEPPTTQGGEGGS